jgi:hypothetical protein
MMCSFADDVACGNEVFCGKLKDCKYFKNRINQDIIITI